MLVSPYNIMYHYILMLSRDNPLGPLAKVLVKVHTKNMLQ